MIIFHIANALKGYWFSHLAMKWGSIRYEMRYRLMINVPHYSFIAYWIFSGQRLHYHYNAVRSFPSVRILEVLIAILVTHIFIKIKYFFYLNFFNVIFKRRQLNFRKIKGLHLPQSRNLYAKVGKMVIHAYYDLATANPILKH